MRQRRLDVLLGHGLRQQPRDGRPEERLRGAERRLDHGDQRDARRRPR